MNFYHLAAFMFGVAVAGRYLKNSIPELKILAEKGRENALDLAYVQVVPGGVLVRIIIYLGTLAIMSVGIRSVIYRYANWPDMCVQLVSGASLGILGGFLPILFLNKIRSNLRGQLLGEGVVLCRTCGYDLKGLTLPRCSECGREFDFELINPDNELILLHEKGYLIIREENVLVSIGVDEIAEPVIKKIPVNDMKKVSIVKSLLSRKRLFNIEFADKSAVEDLSRITLKYNRHQKEGWDKANKSLSPAIPAIPVISNEEQQIINDQLERQCVKKTITAKTGEVVTLSSIGITIVNPEGLKQVISWGDFHSVYRPAYGREVNLLTQEGYPVATFGKEHFRNTFDARIFCEDVKWYKRNY